MPTPTTYIKVTRSSGGANPSVISYSQTGSPLSAQEISDLATLMKEDIATLQRTPPTNQMECPKCHATELHSDQKHVQIRAFKVQDDDGQDWSQCLVCSGAYDKPNGTFTQENHNDDKGWFRN